MHSCARFLAKYLIAVALMLAAGSVLSRQTSCASATESGLNQIEHIVVIFQENISFDHYFATYPHAANPPGQPQFHGRLDTPTVNGLTPELLERNPNGANPFRIDRSQALTCGMNHRYSDQQKSYNGGALNRFLEFGTGHGCDNKAMVMGYFDGNTVTAYWNIAQRFAMSDNFFGTTFGPSTLGAVNLISGQTGGVTPSDHQWTIAGGTLIGDPDPELDECGNGEKHGLARLSGVNVGDLLNAKNVSWGWFEGGFRPSSQSAGKAECKTAHANIGGKSVADYIPHHQPFQYYQSTANPRHLPPSSTALIGRAGDQANHQYDLEDFWSAVDAGNMPSVSYLKAPAYQDGHAGYSDPLDEQTFVAGTVNRLQQRPEWARMVIIIAYDDSDGWYDHVSPPLVNASNIKDVDALTGPGACGTSAPGAIQGRCGYGPRLPLLAASPFARINHVDHALIDQTSILRLIEDRFGLGRIGGDSFDGWAGSMEGLFDFEHPHAEPLLLDPKTGEAVKGAE
jgi:phospholipase C